MSQTYESSADFEAVFGQLFERAARDDPVGMDELIEQRMVIRFRVHDPEVDLWVDGRSAPVEASFDRQDLRPTLTAELSGDTLHELLLGSLPLGRAVMWRRLKVKGSMSKAMKLESLLHACQAVYPDLVAERD